MTTAARESECATAEVALRRLPYPYRAMLAICSDLDGTPDRRVYREIARFLNTTETTSMGPGCGLEVGNSIYFDMPPTEFAYWNTDDAGRAMVRDLIRSGHIDCLHSYGMLATNRCHAERALDELTKHSCRLEVWIDHSKAPSNFGVDVTPGAGDVRESPVYHADLTMKFGIKYVWRGRVTSVVGQDIHARLGGLLSFRHPLGSSCTVAKEQAKRILAAYGSAKYALHGPNRVIVPGFLRDGSPVLEFLRCNPHWAGPGAGATNDGLAEALTGDFLDLLVQRRGVSVIYTHLGKVANPDVPFAEPTRKSLYRLADYQRDGKILVTTTHRLLQYLTLRDSVRWSARHEGDRLYIEVAPDDSAAAKLDGLTFVTAGRKQVVIRLADGIDLPCEVSHPDGNTCVTVPWRRLAFPGN